LYKKASNLVGKEELLFESSTPKGPMSWSPDGKSIVFVNYDPNTQAHLWVLPFSGDRQPTPYLRASGFQSHPQISPDGHWIADRSGGSGISQRRGLRPELSNTRLDATGVNRWRLHSTMAG
jgi:Tol biopolymer transport system component